MQKVSRGIACGTRCKSVDRVEDEACRIVGCLAGLGIGQGDCVALLRRNDIGFIEATFGIMLLGAYAVPINWHFKSAEIDYILADSGAKACRQHRRGVDAVLAEQVGSCPPR